jgi:DMSO/TMAO reductase YedYZ heme-binding membrane subunit
MESNTISNQHFSRIKVRWLLSVIFVFTIYATVRYNIFKGVDPIHFPLYIVNKIFSISGIFFLALSYSVTKLKWLRLGDRNSKMRFAKFSGLAGFSLAAMHVFISMIIISPEYYPKFYSDSMLNLKGELSMLMGVLSIYCFSIPAIATIPFMQETVGIKKWQKRQRIGYLGLLTALLHGAIMGFSGWLEVHEWPGYLPPITMLCVVIAAVPLILKLLRNS